MECPKCKQNQFGIWSIHATCYYRMCKSCLHKSEKIALPAIRKKVLYVDQFAISDMAKATRTIKGKNSKKPIPEYWSTLSKQIQLLVACQLVVCPESNLHFIESLLDRNRYKAFRDFYEMLSRRVAFEHPETIQSAQIVRALREKLGHEHVAPFDRGEAFATQHNQWLDTIWQTETIDWQALQLDEEFRQSKFHMDKGIEKAFRQWQGDKSFSFDQWVREEVSGCATNFKNKPNLKLICNGNTEFLDGFFESTCFSAVDWVKITSHMLAYIAQQAAKQGRNKLPTPGFGYDVLAISSYMPYCDAMFIDNECQTMLSQNPLRDRLGYPAILFSANTIDKLVDYLRDIASNAHPEHLNIVASIYGDDLVQNFFNTFRISL